MSAFYCPECVEAETEDVCSFCGSQWTADSPDYNGCCAKDEELQLAREAACQST